MGNTTTSGEFFSIVYPSHSYTKRSSRALNNPKGPTMFSRFWRTSGEIRWETVVDMAKGQKGLTGLSVYSIRDGLTTGQGGEWSVATRQDLAEGRGPNPPGNPNQCTGARSIAATGIPRWEETMFHPSIVGRWRYARSNPIRPPTPIVPVRQSAKDKVHDLRNGARIGGFRVETSKTAEPRNPN